MREGPTGHLGGVPRALSLTFDDGPDPRWTGEAMRALERHGVRATFFVVGERVREHPELVWAAIDAGHEVQLHCHRHTRHSELSAFQIERDTREGLAALARVGLRPTAWRTPWGIRTPASEEIARRYRLRLVNWTIDTHDWRGDSASRMLARVDAELADGGVVLMHDALGPGALRGNCENTVELIGELVAAARSRGLDVGPLWLQDRDQPKSLPASFAPTSTSVRELALAAGNVRELASVRHR